MSSSRRSDESLSPRKKMPRVIYCDEHSEQKLELYCTQCKIYACAHCMLFGVHKGHECKFLMDVYDEAISRIKSKLTPLQQKTGDVRIACDKLYEVRDQMNIEAVESEALVKAMFQDIKNSLVDKEKELIAQIHESKDRIQGIIQHMVTKNERAYDIMEACWQKAQMDINQGDPHRFVDEKGEENLNELEAQLAVMLKADLLRVPSYVANVEINQVLAQVQKLHLSGPILKTLGEDEDAIIADYEFALKEIEGKSLEASLKELEAANAKEDANWMLRESHLVSNNPVWNKLHDPEVKTLRDST
eukprot:GILI01020076.1.p1 GENE.GILI01020076.1~~GILI01020076.1.p1  ORF type:complete len:322 (-),score=34.19 GILI01020076.1:100-1008(-)